MILDPAAHADALPPETQGINARRRKKPQGLRSDGGRDIVLPDPAEIEIIALGCGPHADDLAFGQLVAPGEFRKTLRIIRIADAVIRIGPDAKPVEPRAQELFDLVSETSMALGRPLGWPASGGVCDGNNIAACGVPVVDTMGARGGAIHSPDEYLIVPSLAERAALSAVLLHRLAGGDSS